MPQVELQIIPVTPDMGPTPAEEEQIRNGFDERVYNEIITPEKTPYLH